MPNRFGSVPPIKHQRHITIFKWYCGVEVLASLKPKENQFTFLFVLKWASSADSASVLVNAVRERAASVSAAIRTGPPISLNTKIRAPQNNIHTRVAKAAMANCPVRPHVAANAASGVPTVRRTLGKLLSRKSSMVSENARRLAFAQIGLFAIPRRYQRPCRVCKGYMRLSLRGRCS